MFHSIELAKETLSNDAWQTKLQVHSDIALTTNTLTLLLLPFPINTNILQQQQQQRTYIEIRIQPTLFVSVQFVGVKMGQCILDILGLVNLAIRST